MARKKREEDEIVANLLPVMNIMFLLIPALLMAMEFASMASINVSPPKFSSQPSEPKPEEEKKEKPLNLKVFIMEDGYRVSADGQQEGADAGKAAVLGKHDVVRTLDVRHGGEHDSSESHAS